MMREERGLVLVMVAVLATVLLSMCALAIGLGFISAGQHHLRLVADAAAYAALEAYSRQDSSVSHSARMQAGLARANLIISQNKVVGMGVPKPVVLAEGDSQDGVAFGQYVVENPADPQVADLCPEDQVPCFRLAGTVANGATPIVNAVSIRVGSQSSSPLLAPFSGVVGASAFSLEANGMAAVTPRCGAFVLDASRSVAFDSHFSNLPSAAIVLGNTAQGEPYYKFNLPGQYPSLASYRVDALKKAGGAWKDCTAPADFALPGQIEFLFWCNQGRTIGATWTTTRPAGELFSGPHYKSDFRPEVPMTVGPSGSSVAFDVLVDRYADTGSVKQYYGPQPLMSFLLAFYKAVEVTKSQATGADRFLLLGATGRVRVQYPPAPPEGPGTTTNLDYMLQVLNGNNRGIFTAGQSGNSSSWTVPPIAGDTFVSLGLLPIFSTPGGDITGDNSTNLVLAIDRAADALATSCPSNSRRFLMVASDWVPNCSQQGSTTTCIDEEPYSLYLNAEGSLLSTVQQKLVDNRIALTGMVAGNYVRPHLMNRLKPSCAGGANDPDCFVSLDEAGLFGYSASFTAGPTNFFDPESTVPNYAGNEKDKQAFLQLGQPGVIFGRAVPLMAQLATATGGTVCPLMDVGAVNQYTDHDGDAGATPCGACPASNPDCTPCALLPSNRTVGQVQTTNPEYLSKSLFAAKCGFDVVGRQPFSLVDPPFVFTSAGACVSGCTP
jgi:hypothetical protein